MTDTEIVAMLKELAKTCRCPTCTHGRKHQTDDWWWCTGAHGGGHYEGFGCFEWQPRKEKAE